MPKKTKYKYISFHQFDPWLWSCVNNRSGHPLGAVGFWEGWNQWVFEPRSHTKHSASCLRDIAHFLEQLNESNDD